MLIQKHMLDVTLILFFQSWIDMETLKTITLLFFKSSYKNILCKADNSRIVIRWAAI